MAALMKMKLANQSACGILESLIARLVLENKVDGLTMLLHALRYLRVRQLAAEYPH
jgi:hypothetical protein